jgi:hypothetical protein
VVGGSGCGDGKQGLEAAAMSGGGGGEQGLEVVVKRGGEVLLPGVYPTSARHPARYPPLARRLPSSLCFVLLSMLEAVEDRF